LYGAPSPADWVGKSLLADLRTKTPEQRSVLIDVPPVGSVPAKQAVVQDQLKVIFAADTVKVFDLAQDPAENVPLSGETASSAVNRAREELKRIRTVPGSPCPSSGRTKAEEAI
jgi:hypothetical protein